MAFNVQISNQKPAVLYNIDNILPILNPQVDTSLYLTDIENHINTSFVQPLYQPLTTNNPVSIIDIEDPQQPKPIDPDTITNYLNQIWITDQLTPDITTSYDPTISEFLLQLYKRSMMYNVTNNWHLEEQLAVEIMSELKLPLPTPVGTPNSYVQYTEPIDIIPAAKQLLTQATTQNKKNWFACLAGYTHYKKITDTLVITVDNDQTFNNIKQQLNQFITNINLSTDVQQLLQNFIGISLKKDLSTTILMPQNQKFASYSFNRILLYVLSQFEKTNSSNMSVQPLDYSAIYTPKQIIILNLENYAHASPAAINQDWLDIQKAIAYNKQFHIITLKKLQTAKSVTQVMKKLKDTGRRRTKNKTQRIKQRHFKGVPINNTALINIIKNIITTHKSTKPTTNIYKTYKKSYMRAARRDPNNPDIPGSMLSTKYYPDIHYYIDTSGSISETQHRDNILTLIKVTKELNTDLYISSFSHIISQPVKLNTQNKSITEIYKEFMKIPKVTGGTRYQPVWASIDQIDELNKNQGKAYRLNFIATDFEFTVPRQQRFSLNQPCVKNTYYMPISLDPTYYKDLKKYAQEFAKQMQKAGDLTITARMLLK